MVFGINLGINSEDGAVIVPAFGPVDSGLIPSRVKPMTAKLLVFTACAFS